MSFNFPNSPTGGQTYQPVGGPTYTWDGTAWVIASPNTVTAQTRNRIVNGAMQVSQELGNTAVGTSAQAFGYIADQFQATWGVTPGTAAAQRVQLTTPNGSKDRVRMAVGTAKAVLGAGDWMQIVQFIEGGRMADFLYGTASARQSMLRFGWKSPAGTYSVSLRNNANNRSYLANFTVAAGQANTDTVQTLIIPGDTTGAWLTDTGIGMMLAFNLAVGSNSFGVAGWQAGNLFGTSSNTNGMATAGAVYELFDVGLYLDPLATGVAPRWELPDEADELIACMRYWERLDTIQQSMWMSGTANYAMPVNYKAAKRTGPAISITKAAGSLTSATPNLGGNSALQGWIYWPSTGTGEAYVNYFGTINARM